MGSHKNLRWLGIVGIFIVMLGLTYVSHLVRGDTTGRRLLKIGIEVLGFAPIPFVSKLEPGASENRIPMTRWAMVLGLLLTTQVVAEFQDDWFPNNHFAAHFVVAISLLLLCGGVASILFWRRDTRSGG